MTNGQQIKKTAHKAIAGFMALWLSGIIFLLCCEKLNAKQAEAEFCPLAKMSGHCDKTESGAPVIEAVADASVECCAFLPVVFDKARKIEQTQTHAAITPTPAATKFHFPRPAIKTQPAVAFHARVPDRHATYLINRNFRI
jgi:hypothetical protein